MTQRIILFNGPPRSGKDTAARACIEAEDLNGHFRVFDRMSMPIKRAFAGMTGQHIDRWGNVDYFEEVKEFGVKGIEASYRQWQIDFSERFMKPLYGDNVFVRLFIQRQVSQHRDAVVFVPDCGFDIEYSILVNAFGVENVLVVKIYRPGADFRGDSRSWLKVGSFGDKRDVEQVLHVNNAGTEDEFRTKVIKKVGDWLGKGTP